MLGHLAEHRQMRLLGNVQRQPGMLAWLEAEIGVWWRDGSGRGTHFIDGTCQGRLRAHTRERELRLASRVHRRGKVLPGVSLFDQTLVGEGGRGYNKKSGSRSCTSHFTSCNTPLFVTLFR
jgi:hypothetical protein